MCYGWWCSGGIKVDGNLTGHLLRLDYTTAHPFWFWNLCFHVLTYYITDRRHRDSTKTGPLKFTSLSDCHFTSLLHLCRLLAVWIWVNSFLTQSYGFPFYLTDIIISPYRAVVRDKIIWNTYSYSWNILDILAVLFCLDSLRMNSRSGEFLC